MKYLGMQIMVEGLALAAFGMITQTSNEPLIRQIVEMIMRDEARHVAFGVLSLEEVYRDMSSTELREREELVIEAAMLMRDRLLRPAILSMLARLTGRLRARLDASSRSNTSAAIPASR